MAEMSMSPTRLPLPAHRRTQSAVSPLASRRSSSQRVWEEDYFADERDTQASLGEISPPPPAALTTRPYPRSIPLTAEEEAHPARQARTHQRSRTELLPSLQNRSPARENQFQLESASLNRNRSPIKTISTKKFEDDFMPTLTGDKDRKIKIADKSRGGFAGWFSGASVAVPLGVDIVEKETPASGRNESTEDTPTKLQKRPPISTMDSNNSASSTPKPMSTSMFSGLFSPKSASKPIKQRPEPLDLENDEFLTLDIDGALFPGGIASPFSPASFNNLLMNAEGLLLRLQTAYKLRTISLAELQAEKEAQAEEYEEATIRATSLKSQLEDMARQAAEHEATIKELSDELAKEKKTRAEEREARERSILLVKSQRSSYSSITSPTEEGPSHFPPSRKIDHRRWRESCSSADISENEDGLFSRSDSPAPTIDSSILSSTPSTYAQSNSSMTEIGQATVGRFVPNPSHQKPKLVQQSQPSTFQKVMKSMSPVTVEKEDLDRLGSGEDSCGNCRGRDVGFAWGTVGLLKVENKVLKERVCELEEGLDGALDAVMFVASSRGVVC